MCIRDRLNRWSASPISKPRWYTHTRIIRTRASVDTEIGYDTEYHRGFEIGDADQRFNLEAIRGDFAVGDVIKLQMRVRRQSNSNATLNTAALTCTVAAANTRLDLIVF